MVMHSIQLAVLLLFFVSSNHVLSRPRHRDIDDKLTIDREVAFYCYKQKICTPGNEKVCGYDPLTPWLAVFADLCTLYKANCQRVGMFHLVAKIVCDTKIKYDKEHVNETFEYIHILSTTETMEPRTKSSTGYTKSPKVKEKRDNFPAFHCYKKRTCTPGGEPVCGIDVRNNTTAEFKDLCTLHGVNCFKQGRYFFLETKACNASVIFGNVITGPYGQTSPAYETIIPTTTEMILPTTDMSSEEDTDAPIAVLKISPSNVANVVRSFFGYLTSAL